jgi:hypothetical protein
MSAAAVALAGAAACLLATDARAAEIDGLRSMDVRVFGRLDEHCSVGKIDDADFGDLATVGKRRASRVALDCNMPITVTITATNGALAHERYPGGQGPFAGSVPYSLGVELPVRHPTPATLHEQYEGADLIGAGQSFNTGDGIAVDGMRLEVALHQPASDAGLLAGSYAETIEITVTPG